MNDFLSYLQEKSKSDEFSGAVLLAKDDQVIFEYSAGFSNKKLKIVNVANTKFNIGSISKLFTAIAICQLVEQKKVSFQDPVSKYLPNYPNETIRDTVTIHHLLTHTSGLGSFINTKYLKEYLDIRDKLKTIDDIVKFFSKHKPDGSLGEFLYSADGFELLGSIIEKVNGTSYDEYINYNIFKISGMINTDNCERDRNNIKDDVAIGYTNIDYLTGKHLEETVENWGRLPIKGSASGNTYSTSLDLYKFSQAFMNNQLVSENMRKIMLMPHVSEGTYNGITKSTGYGFAIFRGKDYERIGHAGQFDGVSARLDIYPDDKFIAIVLSNYDAPVAFDVAKMARNFYKR